MRNLFLYSAWISLGILFTVSAFRSKVIFRYALFLVVCETINHLCALSGVKEYCYYIGYPLLFLVIAGIFQSFGCTKFKILKYEITAMMLIMHGFYIYQGQMQHTEVLASMAFLIFVMVIYDFKKMKAKYFAIAMLYYPLSMWSLIMLHTLIYDPYPYVIKNALYFISNIILIIGVLGDRRKRK